MPDEPLKTRFPGATVADTVTTLFVPDPVITTTLTADLDSADDESIFVADNTGAPSPGYAVTDSGEIIYYHIAIYNSRLWQLRRGEGGTTPADSLSGATIKLYPVSGAVEAMRDALIEAQSRLITLEARLEIVEIIEDAQTLTTDQSGHVLSNEGATGDITVNLPAAASGLNYTFCTVEDFAIIVTAVHGDTILQAGSESSSGGTVQSPPSKGFSVKLVALNSSKWTAVSENVGNWSAA